MLPEFESDTKTKRRRKAKIGDMYIGNMKDHQFDKKYDLIYASWALNYLNDDDAKELLIRAKDALNIDGEKPGTIILKETIKTD